MPGVAEALINEVPLAVVDLETTGLSASGDRVVEIAIVRREPRGQFELVLDTLVNPGRRVTATEIHGITDRDVKDAPTFAELTPTVTDALSDAVFASYNVYFDAKFVDAELARAGIQPFPPHLCLMYMRPLLGIGPRCSLVDACRQHGVRHLGAHMAGDDALASAELWLAYGSQIDALGLRTFADLAKRKRYKFTKSFSVSPLPRAGAQATPRLKSRRRETVRPHPEAAAPAPLSAQDRRGEYWDALKAVLADLTVTPDEITYLERKRQGLRLSEAEVRSLHARAFTGLVADLTDDHEIDDTEANWIAVLAGALRQLGWSPGDPVGPRARPVRQEKKSLLNRILGR